MHNVTLNGMSLPSANLSQCATLLAPHLPDCPSVTVDGMRLTDSRDYMTALAPNDEIDDAIGALLHDWSRNPEGTQSIQRVRNILDAARALPRGNLRTQAMNTVVRGFGQPEALATLLDMMRASALRTGSPEAELSLHSRAEMKHSSYGWAGQTKLVSSSSTRIPSTLPDEPGVQAMLGHVPASMWGLNMHIWQPNPNAKGFPCGMQPDPTIVVEPPHSHPFDFVSMVAIGEMRQSTYTEQVGDEPQPGMRYGGVSLTHVHGVWPPHIEKQPAAIATLDDRITLSGGDSYYMPCNVVHDVEINALRARTCPAITLFLRSEAVVRPHVYMAASMVQHHEDNPDLERSGHRLSDQDWHAKLRSVSAYLRGKDELVLDEIVRQSSSYGFFHE